MDSFGKRLWKVMRDKDLNNTKAGKAGGVSHTTIRKYLDDIIQPGRNFLDKFLEKFNDINPSWFILGIGDPYKNDEPKVSESELNYSQSNELLNIFRLIEKVKELDQRVKKLEIEVYNLKNSK